MRNGVLKLNQRSFAMADQLAFAAVSGDANPLHMDESWASVNFPGATVVHGMHAVLWALDVHLVRPPEIAIGGIDATFAKPILLGDIVTTEASDEGRTLRLRVRGETMALVRLKPKADLPDLEAADRIESVAALVRPVDRSAQDAFLHAAGAVALPSASAELVEMFPVVANAVGLTTVQGLAALSTLVGMECPGLHSLFSEFSVVFGDRPEPALRYCVARFDAIFSRVEMQVDGLGLSGRVAAFAGQGEPPVPESAALRPLVTLGEFTGQRPLVVGASSGLGAVTARLLALGGARPILTWSGSRAKVDAVQALIHQDGGACEVLRLDVSDPQQGIADLSKLNWDGNQVYYFPSPRIFRRRLDLFEGSDLRDFLRVYVDGFYAVMRELMALRPAQPLTVFYPSSVAVDESRSDMLEYKMAKTAGELLCARLVQRYKSLHIVIERLPRIATRQTSTFVRTHAESAEGVMAPLIRKVQAGN